MPRLPEDDGVGAGHAARAGGRARDAEGEAREGGQGQAEYHLKAEDGQ